MRSHLSLCKIVNTNSELDGMEVIIMGVASKHDDCVFYIIGAIFGEMFGEYSATIMISSCLQDIV